jgi:hypothetical protein
MVSSFGPTTRAGRLITDRHRDRMPRITVGDVLEKVEVWARESRKQKAESSELPRG